MKYKKMTAETWDSKRSIPPCPAKGAFEVTYVGNTYFIVDGKLHREDGPAEIRVNGSQYYYQNDLLHRLDGPAVVLTNGTQKYYQHGKLHRTDGPAWVWADGSQSYFIFDHHYPQKEEWELKVLQLNLKEQIL